MKSFLSDYINTGKTFVDLYEHFMGIGDKEIIKRLKEILKANPNQLVIKEAIAIYEETDNRELSGVKTTLKRSLNFITSEIWRYVFSKDGLDFYDYAVNNRDLFICVDQATVENHPKVIRMLFNLLKSTLEILPPKILAQSQFPLILDEIAQLGSLEEIEKIYEIFGDRGVRMTLFFQSIDQVDKFKKAELIKSIELKQIFGVRDAKTIKWIQELAGKKTVLLTSKSSSDSTSKGTKTGHLFADHLNKSNSASESQQEVSTELLHTDYIRELNEGKQIVFFRNLKPFVCDRVVYYEDRRYSGRFSTNFVYHRNLIDYEQAEKIQQSFNDAYDNDQPWPERINENALVENETDNIKSELSLEQKALQMYEDDDSEPLSMLEILRLNSESGTTSNNEGATEIKSADKKATANEDNLNKPRLDENKIANETHLNNHKDVTSDNQDNQESKYIEYTDDEALRIYTESLQVKMTRKELMCKYRMSPHRHRKAKASYEEKHGTQPIQKNKKLKNTDKKDK